MKDWTPAFRATPARLLDAPTAWDGMESVLSSLMCDFKIPRYRCLEFGVQHAYSTVALSNFFDQVVGVDTFLGDPYAGEHYDNYHEVVAAVKPFENIYLIHSDWREWCKSEDAIWPEKQWDLIHVDIFHTYPETFECGQWALKHSRCVLFHDTLSFPAVARAVENLASMSGRQFYNLNEKHGLGILSEVRL